MSPEVFEWWSRANRSLAAARACLDVDPNSVASRAYYSAFEAVQALLSVDGIELWKHQAVHGFVHRDLVRPGIWPKERGRDYDDLMHWRSVADYVAQPGVVTREKAAELVAAAERIIEAVRERRPEAFVTEARTEP